MTTTPNMDLVLPDVSVTIGPDWANDLNTALSRVDLHDHSTNYGVPVTPAGMSINVDLPFAGNNANNVLSVRFAPNSAALATASDISSVYQVSGDLYYNNSAGTPVQITSGSAVVSPGSGAVTSKFPASYPYGVLTTDAQKVLLVTTSAARSITLPAATTNMCFQIKDITGTAHTHNITITPAGSDTIEGASSYVCGDNFGAWTVVSDGISAWYVI